METPRAIGAKASYVTLNFDDGYQLDLNELERLIKSDTKLVSLTYPHNPTGAVLTESRLRELVNLIEKKNTYLLLDETYRDMTFNTVPPVAASLSERVISISSMSKSYGLPGIRIGWIISQNRQLMETFLAAKEQIFITNSVVDEEIAHQYFANKHKHFASVKQEIIKNFNVLKEFMAHQSVLEWVEPRGGCVAFLRIKKDIAMDVVKFHQVLLDKYKTYVGRGHWFEEDDRCFRVGYSWDKTNKLVKGLSNMLEAIDDARG